MDNHIIMDYEIEEIAAELKKAREAKGFSQRAVSVLAGVPQSHLSKIENAAIDIRLSSLIQLARSLDLELKLVPKKALPAVEGLIRSLTKPRHDDDGHLPGPAYRLEDDDG
jgi:transcriptional regulator with XRE-family HTH domain